MALSLTARLVAIVVAGALAFALLLFAFAKIDDLLGGTHDALVSDSSRAALHLHEVLVTVRAKAKAAELAKAHSARKLLAVSDSLRHHAPAPLTHSDTVWMAIADTTRMAAAGCFTVLASCQERADAAEAETAVLAARLGDQLRVGKCRVLFVAGCPSRAASFVIGALLGVAGGYVVAKP